jgi:hypothetical protein
MRRSIIALFMLLPFAAASAEAITIRDIIELSRAKLSDEVLLALIEVDGGVFPIDTETLTTLKAAGVSEQVIVAIVKSGRTRPAHENQQAPIATQEIPPPEIIVQRPATEVVREVVVPMVVPMAVPIYVPVPIRSYGGRREIYVYDRFGSFGSIDGSSVNQTGQRYLTDTPPQRKSSEPVYWGHGGKLRPDAWQPGDERRHRKRD